MSNTNSRRSLLRYTRSVHKLCQENGKEEELSDGEPSTSSQPSGVYHAKTFSHKSQSARMPLESIFTSSTTTPSTSTPTSPKGATISAGSSRSLSINTQSPPPKGDLGSPLNFSSPIGSPLESPLGSPLGSPSGSPSGKKTPRRPLIRESASLHLPVRQIEQEGAGVAAAVATMGRKDTITLYDWFKAMDAEVEKERAYRGTLRKSKTMRPAKAPARENSNFDYFVKQVEEAESRKAAQQNNNASKPNESKPNNATNNTPTSTPTNNNATPKNVTTKNATPNNATPNNVTTINNDDVSASLVKSKSMSRVESRWGIFDPPAAMKKGTMRRIDGASLPKDDANNIILDKQIADEESLKVFMQAWNMLDTFEEHLAVQVELAEVEENNLQLAKEKPPQDPSSQLIDVSFEPPTSPKPKEVPLDLVLLLSPDVKLPNLDPTEAAATASKTTPEPSSTPSTPATPSKPEPAPSKPEPSKPEPSKPESSKPEPAISKPAQTTPEPAKSDQSTNPVVTPPDPATDPHQSVASLPKPVQETITAITTTTAPESSEKTKDATPAPSGESKTTTEPAASEPSPRDAIPSSYKGPHYSNPIPADFVENLLQYCVSEGPNAIVPRAYVSSIISDALEIFKSEPAIIDIPLLEKESKVVVVGDIHGQFPDLITILRDTDLPKTGGKMTLVFNGDFVDRGPAGVEVLLCLYSMKLLAPKNIYLHRGNHELESINRKYNFAEQVTSKYDNELFLQIQDSFAQLPLGCVIAKKVLVIHGGLPEDPISLGQIRALPKLREDPTKATGGPEKIVQAILWSDPRDRRGARPSKRGAGVEFGPDITQAFLARSDLDLLVRSHEMVEEGYQLNHGGGIMTIFSASYYCGVSTNKGAFAVFTHGGDMKRPNIVQYYAQAYSARDNVLKSCVIETLEKLREMIFVNRHRLNLDFSKRDTGNTGKVTKAAWCEAMSSVMGLHISWNSMLPYLAKAEKGDVDKINFTKFLDRYKITKEDDDEEDDEDEEKRDKEEDMIKAWQKEKMGQMCIDMHALVAPKLDDCFDELDKDNDGKLSYTEFMQIFETLKIDPKLPNGDDNNYYDLMRRIDKDEDGTISKKDFEESLSVFMDRAHTLFKEEWILVAIGEMRKAIDKNFDFIANPKMRLKSVFRKCKAEGGKVQRRGFVDWIERTLEIEKYTAVQKLRLATYVDFNGNGKISWKEFKKVFKTPEYYNDIQKNLFKPAAR